MRTLIASACASLLLGACTAPQQHEGLPPAEPPTEPNESVETVTLPIIKLPGGIEVDRSAGEVRVPAYVGIRQGWLEQVACVVDTREHESLLVVEVKPSQVHEALLALGLEPGEPGRWSYDRKEVAVTAPRGDQVVPLVRWHDAEGDHERPLSDWIHGADGRDFPAGWVFAGSRFAKNPRSLGPGEHYVADYSGSLVGLVTFGDETVAARAVFADQEAVEAVNWEAWTERMPPEGTDATLVLRRGAGTGAAR